MKKLLPIIILLACTLSVPPSFACEKKPKHNHVKGISASAVSKSINRNTNKISNKIKINNNIKVTNNNDLKSNNELSAKTGDLRAEVITEREYPSTPMFHHGATTQSTSIDDSAGYGYNPLEITLAGKRWFTRQSLRNMAKGVDIVGGYTTINETELLADTKWLHLVFMDDPGMYPGLSDPFKFRTADVKGYAEAQTVDYGNTLIKLFGELAGQAMDDGCNVFVVYRQGYDNYDHTSGGGVGFAWAKASDTTSGAGGPGWAWAEAGKYARSYIGAVGIVDTRISNPKR